MKHIHLTILLAITSTLGLLTSSYLFFENMHLRNRLDGLIPSNEIVSAVASGSNCEIRDIEYMVSGNSMFPLLRDGQKVQVQENYYACTGKVARGDVIIYRSVTTNGDIIKRVRALPGDILKIKDGTLLINGEVMKNSAGETYSFSEKESGILLAYTQAGILQSGTFFAFGDNISNSIDSRKMGGLGMRNFVGKVLISVGQ